MNKIWIIVVVTVFAASAAVQAPGRPQPPAKDNIGLHRDYWQSQHISHYRYALQISCRCGFTRQPYTVEVRNGKLIWAVDGTGQPISSADFNAPPHAADWFYGLTSIESLFDYARTVSGRASAVEILYDAKYGFPRLIYIDWAAGQVGDEVGLHIMNFTVLP